MRLTSLSIALLLLSASALGAAQPAVKKSEQGICHERGSGAYRLTKHFEPYDTLELCLASGGRVAKYAESEAADAQEKPSAGAPSWLRNLGGKIGLIVGILVIVGAAFLLSRRQSPAQGSGQNDHDPNHWEGMRRE